LVGFLQVFVYVWQGSVAKNPGGHPSECRKLIVRSSASPSHDADFIIEIITKRRVDILLARDISDERAATL